MSSNSIWKIVGETATVKWPTDSGEVAVTVDTQTPVHGAEISIGSDSVNVFALEGIAPDQDPGAEKRSDLYVRGDDVIMRFESPQHPFDREIYWRVVEDEIEFTDADGEQEANEEEDDEDGSLFGLELIYSLQTDQLDTRPAPQAVSKLPMKSFKAYTAVGAATDAERSWEICDDLEQSQLVIAKLEGGALVAIGVLPSDLQRLELENQACPAPVTFHLQTEFLEKGVIRRLRMFVGGSCNSQSEAELLLKATQFLNSEIPLTT